MVLQRRECVNWQKETKTGFLNGSTAEETFDHVGLVRALPGWPVHEFIDQVLFGKIYRKVHQEMDEPFKYLGRTHRVLFHDYASAYAIAKDSYPDDPDAVLSAYYHIYYDALCSEDPIYKKYLEKLEILSRKYRKKRRKRTRREKDPLLESWLGDLKKLAELKRLQRILFSHS